MLPTVYVKLSHGNQQMIVRVLLDTGASLNIVTNRVVQYLDLDCDPQNVVIAGVSGYLISKRSTTIQFSYIHEVDDTDSAKAICQVTPQLV